MKRLKSHLQKIKTGLETLHESTVNKYAEELYGTPPSKTGPGKKANLEALEKIHRVTGR